MRKILTIVSVLSLISFNANALDVSEFSVTAGVAHNSAVYGASAKETNRNESNVIKSTEKESGAFAESHQSMFLELKVNFPFSNCLFFPKKFASTLNLTS